MSTAWSDLESPPGRRGHATTTPLVTFGMPRREVAYLNAAARRLLGNPRHIRWQHGPQDDSHGDRIAITNADGESDEFIAAQTNSRRYRVGTGGLVTCTPVLPLVHALPATFKLALDGDRLVVVAKVAR